MHRAGGLQTLERERQDEQKLLQLSRSGVAELTMEHKNLRYVPWIIRNSASQAMAASIRQRCCARRERAAKDGNEGDESPAKPWTLACMAAYRQGREVCSAVYHLQELATEA